MKKLLFSVFAILVMTFPFVAQAQSTTNRSYELSPEFSHQFFMYEKANLAVTGPFGSYDIKKLSLMHESNIAAINAIMSAQNPEDFVYAWDLCVVYPAPEIQAGVNYSPELLQVYSELKLTYDIYTLHKYSSVFYAEACTLVNTEVVGIQSMNSSKYDGITSMVYLKKNLSEYAPLQIFWIITITSDWDVPIYDPGDAQAAYNKLSETNFPPLKDFGDQMKMATN